MILSKLGLIVMSVWLKIGVVRQFSVNVSDIEFKRNVPNCLGTCPISCWVLAWRTLRF
jgi:hypothetical protein